MRQAFVLALRALREAYTRGTAPQQTRAWKLFLLAPCFLLHRAREPGTVGREALLQRSRDFLAGRWDSLLGAARAAAGARAATDAADDEAARERRRSLACANVRRGEVSRARVVLKSAAIAPGTDETFEALSDPARRPPSPRQDVRVDLLNFQPGATCEHFKLLLDDAEALELFVHAANLLAAARVPADVAAAVGLSRLTARRKPGGASVVSPCSDVCRHLRRGHPGVPVCATDQGWHRRTFRNAPRRLSISTLRRPSCHSTAGAPMTRSRTLRF